MKVITEGHKYELPNFEKGGENQVIQFIEKEQKEEGSKELVTLNNGTTNEEVLLMLIDRMKFLQKKFNCRENAIVITKLEESYMWLEQRTKSREARGVEGQHVK